VIAANVLGCCSYATALEYAYKTRNYEAVKRWLDELVESADVEHGQESETWKHFVQLRQEWATVPEAEEW